MLVRYVGLASPARQLWFDLSRDRAFDARCLRALHLSYAYGEPRQIISRISDSVGAGDWRSAYPLGGSGVGLRAATIVAGGGGHHSG